MTERADKRMKKSKILIGTVAAVAAVAVIGAATACSGMFQHKEADGGKSIPLVASRWPSCFSSDEYKEPEFADDENRTNNAFNVADFGEQGSNGWFYRYGKPGKPYKSKQIEKFDGERYYQVGVNGLEVKKDFIQPGEKEAAILEWRAAEKGKIQLLATYVKNINGDKNPSYPDGVTISVYKGKELLQTHKVDVKIDKEILMETEIPDLEVEENESIYFVIDANENNAYDGGVLYAAIRDSGKAEAAAASDGLRTDNNANFIKDFGEQGANGWYYMYGKNVADARFVSSKTENGYINYTSPNLQINDGFIHPAINDDAIISWKPKCAGTVEIRGTYTKFEQNDGNPDWPDGVTVSVYQNETKLFEEKVSVFRSETNKISFGKKGIVLSSDDSLYFVVNANGNASYDGGAFDIAILDRNGLQNEDSVTVDETEIRQNVANVKDDFGKQGNNGWFFQEGYQDEPFGAYNMRQYIEDDKYIDSSYLEIKRDYVNTGESGRSAVIKWRVAQNGKIAVDASYTKTKNEDKNPSWPDGTRVTIYHNSTRLVQQEFEANVYQEITKSLNVSSVNVKRGDYITMVVNGKENNAYDGGKYTFAIRSLSGLVGKNENNVTIENDKTRTNNASVKKDFGKQGQNGWFYQYGYNTDPFCAVNIEKYVPDDKYITKDGVEIKRDYIAPSTKGKSANVKWKVAQTGQINVFLSYTKLKNEDKNVNWPDGVDVTLLHNKTKLRTQYFAPDPNHEITKDMSVLKLHVKKGDYITMIVNGKDNTAYDGGMYSFTIEDATIVGADKKNDSETNVANLASDFGEQGSNGWYYLEGSSLDTASILTQKTDDNNGYLSTKDNGLEIKKDFVQPGLLKDAMYQWVAAQNGVIDITGNYTKFGHQDPNPSWPDGTTVRVYKNNALLIEKKVSVRQGDGNDTTVSLNYENLKVTKGDLITFSIGSNENNAWDGGRLSVHIKPHVTESEYKPAPDNEADLFEDFGEQGTQGWYYGSGNTSGEFKRADYANNEYSSVLYENLLLKKDGVHPSASAGAIYRWIAGADGSLYLNGTFYKSKNENAEDDAPDGVRVEVYKNGTLIDGMSYDIPVSKVQENICKIRKDNLEVSRGDMIDFIITAKENAGWDYGKLEMHISENAGEPSDDPSNPTDDPSNPTDDPQDNPTDDPADDPQDNPVDDPVGAERTNKTNLKESFGKQGNDGWYYGMCDWDGNRFEELEYDEANERYYNNGKPELKKDFVEPGAGRNAAYKWIAAEDGRIVIRGKYVKFPNAEDPNATGVCLRIRLNKEEKFFSNAGICGNNITHEAEVPIEITLDVKKGDEILFMLDPEGNDSYDGGRMEIDISPVE